VATRTHCLVVRSQLERNPRAAAFLADIQSLGIQGIRWLECEDLYFLQGAISAAERQRLACELFSDPISQTAHWRGVNGDGIFYSNAHIVETALRPGVADPVAEQIMRCSRMLGVGTVERAATGQRFVVHGELEETELHALARRVFANPVIQRYALGEIDPTFPEPAETSGQVEIVSVRELAETELLVLSRERRAALDLAEMQAVQNYFRSEGRDPTDVEFEMTAQTWSEHCVHKTFKADIKVRNRNLEDGKGISDARARTADSQVDGILKTYIRAATEKIAAPWIRSAFVDNAGIIDFDDECQVSFKVETHNHPSAIEPFGGANTGTGGVIRDILGVSAKPIAATDVLCFGPQDASFDSLPEGVMHPRRIRSGVVAGIQDYGNKIGIPTVNGAILYDPGYVSNPLVFCGCVGIAPKGTHPNRPQPGDRVIVLGGRTGRDGLRGATFSSATMDAQTSHVAGSAVQIGDPISEKGLVEVITRARDRRLYHAITDCGAGGLSSAVGEIAKTTGASVDLKNVRLKYAGLAPWEIWLSEAQERMVLAVPNAAPLQELCNMFDVELTDIGEFTATGRIVVHNGQQVVLDLDNGFLHGGIPRRSLIARPMPAIGGETAKPQGAVDCNRALLELLAHPDIASKADVVRVYDHEVQGGTVIKPLTGVMNDGPSDACVIKPLGTKGARGIVLSNGINPQFGKRDAYRMALSVVDEAIRNAVAVGADPDQIALLDNFCWGDPTVPETLGSLVEAARGCYDAAVHHQAPFISGKDSLNNEYAGTDGKRHAIPPTLLISAIGMIEDVLRAVTMDLKEPGDALYLLGETHDELGGSHLGLVMDFEGGRVPAQQEYAPALYRALHRLVLEGLVRACHDLGEGGLAVAAAEMCIAGRLGLELSWEHDDSVVMLFSESNGRFLVEVRSQDCAAFEAHLATGLPWRKIGAVSAVQFLSIELNGEPGIHIPVRDLVSAWNRDIPAAHDATIEVEAV
jgi:phosphoribosylformylglycinamidine synthase subunit PurSL